MSFVITGMCLCALPGMVVPEMTYRVSGGMLNLTHSLIILLSISVSSITYCQLGLIAVIHGLTILGHKILGTLVTSTKLINTVLGPVSTCMDDRMYAGKPF